MERDGRETNWEHQSAGSQRELGEKKKRATRLHKEAGQGETGRRRQQPARETDRRKRKTQEGGQQK